MLRRDAVGTGVLGRVMQRTEEGYRPLRIPALAEVMGEGWDAKETCVREGGARKSKDTAAFGGQWYQ
jgi:hypothetical protein